MATGAIRDTAAGLVTAAAAIFCIVWLIPVGIKVPPRVPFAAASPDFFPRFVAWLTLALGVALAWGGARRLLRRRPSEHADRVPADHRRTIRAAIAIAAIFLYLPLIEPLGLVAATGLLMLVLAALYEERRLVVGAVLALLLPYANFLLFYHGLGVAFPLGIFGG